MKIVLIKILIAFLLMPSLVCAMPVCPQYTGFVAESVKPHCGQSEPESLVELPYSVMLFADCTGVELQQSPAPFQMDAPLFTADPVAVISAHNPFAFQYDYLQQAGIRGPPVWQSPQGSQSPVYFTTGRLRI